MSKRACRGVYNTAIPEKYRLALCELFVKLLRRRLKKRTHALRPERLK